MAQKMFAGTPVTIATAGTAVPLSATQTAVTSIIIEAGMDNVGYIYVGDDTVDSTNGMALVAGQTLSITSDEIPRQQDEIYLSDVYVDTDTDGSVVKFYYIKRRL
jgi:hypothetical protein